MGSFFSQIRKFEGLLLFPRIEVENRKENRKNRTSKFHSLFYSYLLPTFVHCFYFFNPWWDIIFQDSNPLSSSQDGASSFLLFLFFLYLHLPSSLRKQKDRASRSRIIVSSFPTCCVFFLLSPSSFLLFCFSTRASLYRFLIIVLVGKTGLVIPLSRLFTEPMGLRSVW